MGGSPFCVLLPVQSVFEKGIGCVAFMKSFSAGYVLFCVPKENQKSTRYFRGARGGGLRLPASALCLGRHSHSAGRCPNSSSLFRPLAAVVAVAN